MLFVLLAVLLVLVALVIVFAAYFVLRHWL